MHLIKADRFFAPDTAVSTVIADIQQPCYLIYK